MAQMIRTCFCIVCNLARSFATDIRVEQQREAEAPSGRVFLETNVSQWAAGRKCWGGP
jgi:hypothetical protein